MTYIERKAYCSVCGAELDSGNWYKSDQNRGRYRCKSCECARMREYRLRNRNEVLERQRLRKREYYVHNKRVTGKRNYPSDQRCELCEREANFLQYHHWDGENFSKGLWLCWFCHTGVHFYERGLAPKYQTLKQSLETKEVVI